MGTHTRTLDFEVELALTRDAIHAARSTIAELAGGFIDDGQELGERLSMVVHELLENSHVHGLPGPSLLSLRVEDRGYGCHIRIRVRSRACPEDVHVLRAALAEVEAADDAWQHYAAAMRRAAQTSQGSGLGLARIRAEGDLRLRLAVDGEVVSVEAKSFQGGG